MKDQAVEAVIEKLKALPPEQRAEVEDFVDFLKARKERVRDAAVQRLGEASKKLDARPSRRKKLRSRSMRRAPSSVPVMRIVADTNTVLSGLLWQGPPCRLLDLARERTLTLCISSTLLAELAEVIARDKFVQRVLGLPSMILGLISIRS